MEVNKEKGFTLVELLIVMAIIGILIAVAIIGLSSAQADARNNNRETAVKGISGLIETYYGDAGGTYPAQVGLNLYAGASTTNVQFISPMASGTAADFTTTSDLCKNVIAPSLAPANFTGSCGQVDFTVKANKLYTPDTPTETAYFYIPFQSGTNGQVVVGNATGTPVSGYVIGACLEGSGIFAYSSNGSNAPYTKTANSVTAAGTVTVTCS
jgi:prepilin-type N-terminal cleavage/methylation domain-containing protein